MRVNFRPALLVALSLATGIYLGYLSIMHGALTLVLAIFAGILSIICVALMLLRHRFALPLKVFSCAKNALLGLLFTCAGFMLFYLSFARFTATTIESDGIRVEGTVSDRYITKDGNYYFLLQDIMLGDATQQTPAYGKMFVYVAENPGTGAPVMGDRVSFNAKLKKSLTLSEGQINSYAVRNNILCSAYIAEEDIHSLPPSPNVILSVRMFVRAQLYGNMRDDNAAISYALMLGDAAHIDSGIKQVFSDSGISHVFSVSGLHVGVLSAVFIFLLKKLGAGAKTTFVVCAVLLTCYAALCGFAPSVTRSLIMVLIYLIASMRGDKYDGISAVCAAAILILAVSPLTLFDAGFLLSVSAVLSIFLLYRPLKRALSFLPARINSAVSVSLCAQLGIIPVLCFSYGVIHLLSLILNLIAVPLISAAYIYLLVAMPVSGLMPAVANILFLPAQGMLEIVKAIVGAVDMTGLYTAAAIPFTLPAVLLFYAILVLWSDIVRFAKKGIKPVLCLSAAAMFFLSYGLSYRPLNFRKLSFAAVQAEGLYSVVTAEDGSAALVCYGGTDTDFSQLDSFLYRSAIYGLGTAVSFKCDTSTIKLLLHLQAHYGLQSAALPYNYLVEDIATVLPDMQITYLLSGERYVYKNLQFAAYYYNDSYYGGIAAANGITALYLPRFDGAAEQYLRENMFFDIKLIFADQLYTSLLYYYQPDVYTALKTHSAEFCGLYYTERAGSLIFSIKGDNIIRQYSYRFN